MAIVEVWVTGNGYWCNRLQGRCLVIGIWPGHNMARVVWTL